MYLYISLLRSLVGNGHSISILAFLIFWLDQNCIMFKLKVNGVSIPFLRPFFIFDGKCLTLFKKKFLTSVIFISSRCTNLCTASLISIHVYTCVTSPSDSWDFCTSDCSLQLHFTLSLFYILYVVVPSLIDFIEERKELRFLF